MVPFPTMFSVEVLKVCVPAVTAAFPMAVIEPVLPLEGAAGDAESRAESNRAFPGAVEAEGGAVQAAGGLGDAAGSQGGGGGVFA